MKKFLLTAALILALVTSLTAGTMAYYSTSIGTISSTVQTKEFSFTADRNSNSWKTGVEIAPGDTLTYRITVSNDSEVATDATFVAELEKGYDASAQLKDGMKVSVSREDSMGVTGDTDESDPTSVQLSTQMGESSSAVYTVTVSWAKGEDFGNDLTAKLQGKTITLNMKISGVQSVKPVETDMLASSVMD